MPAHPSSVTTQFQVGLVVPETTTVPVQAELAYDAEDPYAIRIAFRTNRETAAVQWTFARQLLTDGVTAAAGQGDVRAWPHSCAGEPVVRLSLTSPSGNALFELPLPELVEFLAMTYCAVPTGTETHHLDVDRGLASLFSGGPET